VSKAGLSATPETQRVTASTAIWAVSIFALAVLLRALWISYVDPQPFGTDLPNIRGSIADAIFYYGSAESLASGDGLRDPLRNLEHSTRFSPGYPLALSSVFAVFGAGPTTAKAVNVLAGGITAVLVFLIGWKLRGEAAGITAGLLLAVFPSQVFFSTMIMTEVFFAMLSTTLVLLLVLWAEDARRVTPVRAVGLGLLLGFMALVRVEALVLIPALFLLWIIWHVRWQEIIWAGPLVVLAAALVITPWTVRNYARFDEPILITGESTTHPAWVLRVGLSPDYDNKDKYQLLKREPKSYQGLAIHYLENPDDMVTVPFRKMKDLYGDDDLFFWIKAFYIPPVLSPEEAERWGNFSSTVYYVAIAVAAAGSPLWFSLRDRRLFAVLWFVAVWSSVHLLLIPETRYHFPVVPMICVLAALSAVCFWERAAALMRGRTLQHDAPGTTNELEIT
jgi:4-amino-4-deoxy-L-arabinose transferase-like glycosyltransferase